MDRMKRIAIADGGGVVRSMQVTRNERVNRARDRRSERRLADLEVHAEIGAAGLDGLGGISRLAAVFHHLGRRGEEREDERGGRCLLLLRAAMCSAIVDGGDERRNDEHENERCQRGSCMC